MKQSPDSGSIDDVVGEVDDGAVVCEDVDVGNVVGEDGDEGSECADNGKDEDNDVGLGSVSLKYCDF